jgi:AraC family transcriptional regulator of adaptative response/methylated-DNA-[protein]-cysteine methyltransferase
MKLQLAIKTTDGEFTAHYTERGLAQLDFPGARNSAMQEAQGAISHELKRWHKLTTQALAEALEGRAPRELPPLDFAGRTQFQQRVWSVLRRIASGRTKSYSEVAEALGKPGAARAVGSACGANPIPVLVPCHRVLAANRALGGFSGGLDWKRKLLAREGVQYTN